jgi:hypothetical protein
MCPRRLAGQYAGFLFRWQSAKLARNPQEIPNAIKWTAFVRYLLTHNRLMELQKPTKPPNANI